MGAGAAGGRAVAAVAEAVEMEAEAMTAAAGREVQSARHIRTQY